MPNRTERDKEQGKRHFRERYANDPEFRARVIASTKRNKPRQKEQLFAWWKTFKATLRCDTCGEDHPATLDLHHRDASAKEHSIRDMLDSPYSQKRILAEIAKCVVLCSNCHRKLHWQHRNGETA